MRQPIVRILSTTLLCLVLAKAGHTQTAPIPAVQKQMVKRELARQGVDEQELRTRLLEKGIDIDNMSPQSIVSARPQIEATVAEIKAEQSEEAESQDSSIETNEEDGINETEDVKALIDQGASLEEARAEAELANTLQESLSEESNIYGHQIFRNKTLEVYRATDRATAPGTYVLDTGDELAISIFGASQIDLLLEIGDDGFIKPSGIPRIYLRGRTLSEARDLVRSRMSNYYAFGRGQFSLSIDAARTISVSIYGEVQQSGTYTLSALNGPLNALIAAGGPTDRGSVRNIELIREGNRTTIDVYEFLQNPGRAATMDLRDKDIINVPLGLELITISGGVRRPMRYELKANETLDELVNYAGGTIPRAEVNATRVERYGAGITKVLDVDERNFSRFDMQNGDLVEIPVVTNPIEDYVSVTGEVLVDGKFGFRQNLSLEQVINRAGLKPSARRDLAFIQRQNDDGTQRLERVSISAGSPGLQTKMQRGDVISILASNRFIDNAEFTVSGAVRDGEVTLPYPQDGKLSLEEAILLSGGLENNAVSEALIIRTPENNLQERKYLRTLLNEASDFVIEPFDKVMIYTQERFTDNPTVRISGAVRNPVTTTFDASLRLPDLLYMAGGLRYDAAKDRVDIYRLNIDNNETRTLVETLEINEEGEVRGGFELQPFDEVNVRTIAEYAPIETVEIVGEIRFPGLYARITGKNRIGDLINRAGGLTSDAFAEGATLERDGKKVIIELNQIIADQKSTGNIIMMPGDKIVIPKPRETIMIYTANTYAVEFGIDSLTESGLVKVAYQGPQKADWYINNYAGGLTENAKKKAITVTGPAGDIRETKSFLGIRKHPLVDAGSTVYVPQKPPKKQKPDRERTSWSEIAQVVVAAMTTVATLIIINRAN